MYSALNSEFDVIVSGGGLTGVVCAVRLARSGRRVVLVERRGSLGWEIGRARRVFLDLTRWRSLSPTLQELEERFRRVHAMADGVLSAPVVELALDAWIRDAGVQPLFFTQAVRLATAEGVTTGATVATKSGYMQLTAPLVVETDQLGRLARDEALDLGLRPNSAPRPAPGSATHRSPVRSCILIGVPAEAAQHAGPVAERLAARFGPSAVTVRPAFPGQVQLDLHPAGHTYADREHALATLIPEVLAEIRRVPGWEQASLAYIADDEWAPPPFCLPGAPPQGARLGSLIGPAGHVPICESDVVAGAPHGLYLAGPWIAKMVIASQTDELALINRILLGDLVAGAIRWRTTSNEARRR